MLKFINFIVKLFYKEDFFLNSSAIFKINNSTQLELKENNYIKLTKEEQIQYHVELMKQKHKDKDKK